MFGQPFFAIEQVVEYKNDPGNGFTRTLLCFMQVFIVSNRDRTYYFANNNARHFAFNADERFLPVYQFAAKDNKKITHLDSFAETFLPKCTLAQMISRYMVLIASEPPMVACLAKAMLLPVALATSSFVSSAQASAGAADPAVAAAPVPAVAVAGAALLPDFEQAASRRTHNAPAAASRSLAWVPGERTDPLSTHGPHRRATRGPMLTPADMPVVTRMTTAARRLRTATSTRAGTA